MPHDLTLTGERGEIRYGYHCAARLGAWSVGSDRTLTAVIDTVLNRFWLMSQSGLTFALPRANGRVTERPVEGLQIAADARTLTARLVPHKRSPDVPPHVAPGSGAP
jgi:hypothetical protein